MVHEPLDYIHMGANFLNLTKILSLFQAKAALDFPFHQSKIQEDISIIQPQKTKLIFSICI